MKIVLKNLVNWSCNWLTMLSLWKLHWGWFVTEWLSTKTARYRPTVGYLRRRILSWQVICRPGASFRIHDYLFKSNCLYKISPALSFLTVRYFRLFFLFFLVVFVVVFWIFFLKNREPVHVCVCVCMCDNGAARSWKRRWHLAGFNNRFFYFLLFFFFEKR